VITSKSSKFSEGKKILDMVKGLNDLIFANSIDRAEIEILSDRLVNLELQMRELQALRATQSTEASARYLAKAVLPQVAVADGISVDMRTLQATRADVAKNDPLRLMATNRPAAGLSLLIYGVPEQGAVVLRHGDDKITLDLPANPDQMSQALAAAGIDVAKIHSDQQIVGAMEVFSIFIELAQDPKKRISVLSAAARNERDLPVLVSTSIVLAAAIQQGRDGTTNEIIGFLENRHAVVLRPGQRVRGSINDTRTGTEIVFDAHLLDRDFSTVDTKELGIRLGNQSLAAKIIKRGVISQVVVGIDATSAQQIEHLPGAVVHLSFPLTRQSLFSYLLARDASI